MYSLRHPDIYIPAFDATQPEQTRQKINQLSYAVHYTADNITGLMQNLNTLDCTSTSISMDLTQIDEKLKRQAEKLYDIIAQMIECNITKAEFVKLLTTDEIGDFDGDTQ